MVLRFGEINEPADRTGVADATATVMRSGGSAKYPGDKLDEILDGMAASLSIGIGVDSGSAGLSTLKQDFDKGLDSVNPGFRGNNRRLRLQGLVSLHLKTLPAASARSQAEFV